MRVHLSGKEGAPLLVCIHGLMGAADDFDALIGAWEEKFRVILLDLVTDNEKRGFRIMHNGQDVLCFDVIGPKIIEYLKNNFPGEAAYFTGVSLGGRVVYDIVDRSPELVKGAVIIDLGPSQMMDTELYRFLTEVVPSLDLNKDWNGIKEEFAAKLPDRRMRVLLQTQVKYDKAEEVGEWKGSIMGIQEAIENSQFAVPWVKLNNLGIKFIVLKASTICGINDSDIKEMYNSKSFTVRELPGANHFLHLSHTNDYMKAVLDLL